MCALYGGTMGIAAKAEGFRFIDVEKDADYCEISIKRLTS